MFKTSALLSALALGASSSSGLVSAERATALYPHVPLVLWSQHATFKAREAYVDAVFDEVATADVLHTVLSRDAHKDNYNVLSSTASAEPTAEALCVFVRENLKSSQLAAFGSSSYVQSAVKTASSSVIVAHTTRSQSLTQALAGVDHPIVPIDSVAEWIQSAEGKKLLSNGKSDLLVVTIPGDGDERELGEVDAKIKSAAEALLEASKDAGIDFALTGNSAQSIVVQDPFARRSRRLATGQAVTAESIICDAGYLIGLSSTGKAYCFSHYVHMTPEILTALIFGFFFLFLAYVGLTALHAIQTPLRYPAHGPPKGKEF